MAKRLTIRERAAQVRSGTLSPTTLVADNLRRIEQLNSKFNAICCREDSIPTRKAAELAREIGSGALTALRLAGSTFSAKVSIDVEGFPVSDGSLQYLTPCAPMSASMVNRLFSDGAICIGKGNQAEYGKSYFTECPRFGRSSNPFDAELSPGGSGGGDAAAVALQFADFGLGADAAGSVRVPANFCGLFGFIPTRGLISSAGLSRPMQTVGSLLKRFGVIAPHLDDCRLLLEVLAQFDPLDPHSVTFPNANPKRHSTGKFAYFSTLNGVQAATPIRVAISEVARKFEANGLKGEELTPDCISKSHEPFIILAGQSAMVIEDHLSKLAGAPRQLKDEGPLVKALRAKIDEKLPPLTFERFVEVWRTLDLLRLNSGAFFRDYDFILSPVSAALPPKHGSKHYSVDEATYESQQVFQFASFANVLDLPALAFPTGKLTAAGYSTAIPVGVQIVGPRFSDRRLIELVDLVGYRESVAPDVQS